MRTSSTLRDGVVFVLLLSGMLVAQQRPHPEHPVMSVYSPFASMVDALQANPQKLAGAYNNCPSYQYFDTAATRITFQQNVPTSRFAFRYTPPNVRTVAPSCTVWTVYAEFTLNGASYSARDTIQFFIKEVSAPYTQLYTTYYLARSGVNDGDFEIDPPPVAPYNIRPIMQQPKRDLYIGYYIRGDATHTVDWTFATPSSFTSPVRSVAFTSNTAYTAASNIVGQSVDWIASARVCCNSYWPVELSVFRGERVGGKVDLAWKTEAETNNFGFEVQRAWSAEGPWETRGTVAGHGTTMQPRWYSFSDKLLDTDIPAGAESALYRLRQTDFDGTTDELGPIHVFLSEPELPGFRIHGVYPNPVSTTSGDPVFLRYELDEAANVRVAVYDALGREQALLFEGPRAQGLHESAWYPAAGDTGIRTGMFFLRVSSGARSATARVTVVR